MGKRGGPVRSSCPLLDTSAAVFLGEGSVFSSLFRRPKIALDCRARYRHMMRYSYSQHKKWLPMPGGKCLPAGFHMPPRRLAYAAPPAPICLPA